MNTQMLVTTARRIGSSRRLRRLSVWIGGGLVLFGLIGALIVPPIAKTILIEKLGLALHREVAIEKIAINPFALSADVRGFSVKSKDGQEVVGFDNLYVNVSSSSLFRLAPVIDEVTLSGPRLRVTRLAENRYDISDLIDEWAAPKNPPPPETPPARFAVNNIQVDNGKLMLDDRFKGVAHTVADLKLGVPFISSLPSQTAIFVQPHLSAKINGAPLLLEGKSKPFDASHESDLALDLDQLDVLPYLAYAPIKLPFTVKRALLDSQLKIIFKQAGATPAALKLAGTLHLRDLALAEPEGSPLLTWKRLDIGVDGIDLLNRQVVIGEIKLSGFEQNFRVDASGRLNWLEMMKAVGNGASQPAAAKPADPGKPFGLSVAGIVVENAAWNWREEVRGKAREGQQLTLQRLEVRQIAVDSAAQKAQVGEVALLGPVARLFRDDKGLITLPPSAGGKPESSGPPWQFALGKLALNGGAVRYEELGLKEKSVQQIDNLQIGIEGFSTAPEAKAMLTVAARVNQKGAVKIAGDVRAKPLNANLDVDLTAIPILPAQPFFSDKLNVTLLRGQLSTKGSLRVSEDKNGIGGGFKGQVALTDLHTVDKINSADLLRWRNLSIGNVDARFKPLAINIGDIALNDFFARVIVTPEGKINLSQILRQPESEGPAASLAGGAPAVGKASATLVPVETAKEITPIRIDRISLQNGRVNFSDLFVRPNYTVNVNKLNGNVKGLSSTAGSVADLELHGSYGNAAPVDIIAKLNPLAAQSYLDLKGEMRGVDLTTLTPYSGKYAGYAIEKGKLSLFVTYKLENNQLNAENRVFLDQLTFGEKVDSPDATSLPVKLAVALLKNPRGEIDINLPISGSLNDPQFSLGGVIVQVIVNLFVKAVTSPFALIGSMFGGGEELSQAEFSGGNAQLTPETTKKLETLAKAMNERPALKLEIIGRASPEADREGAKRAALDRAVRVEKQKELVKKGVETGAVRTIEMDAKEYPEYLVRVYKEAKFEKPRNLIGLTKGLPVEEMENLLLAHTDIGEEELRQLAMRRAQAVQAWLVGEGKVAMERVFLLAPKIGGEVKEGDKRSPSRVDFSLQ